MIEKEIQNQEKVSSNIIKNIDISKIQQKNEIINKIYNNNWSTSLSHVISNISKKKTIAELEKPNQPVFNACRICKIPFKINCAEIIDDSLLLGTNNGLHNYCLNENKSSIENSLLISTRKYLQISKVNAIKVILSKSGKNDIICVHYISHIQNFKAIKKFENETKMKKLKSTRGCINFTVERCENEIYICCLIPNSIIILKNDENITTKFLYIKVYN
ncbi:hypothetical protein BCR36DRAFT_363271 [Piromyces finnis]|uniref:CNH domain-containing protein n=1 Tax=Piromyces finnis TaxID=1754191 RepID=A0A1Y1UVP6_9FUNG|nr:hypothetical protein BCR36DRAFT_363271 [Piromyces finnis]|eukprot:ORX42007.1 hypothetical protein BCR36DRAFT_363271 [Piromyces finnis]